MSRPLKAFGRGMPRPYDRPIRFLICHLYRYRVDIFVKIRVKILRTNKDINVNMPKHNI